MIRMSDTKAFLLFGFTVGVILTAFTYEAKAQTVNGNQMNTWCSEAPGLVSAYVTGVVDSLYSVNEARFCLPPTGIVKQNVDVVCKGLVDHPEYRAFDASVLTHAFLAEAFPCQ